MLFFFSSRRRHTRFDCDWSSDVCSSDLLLDDLTRRFVDSGWSTKSLHRLILTSRTWQLSSHGEAANEAVRSEERRVGKERRARGFWFLADNEAERRAGALPRARHLGTLA